MGMEGWVEPKEMQGWEAGAARGMPLQLVSRLVEMAADVVDYVAYLDVKYAKKEAKRAEMEAKRAKKAEKAEKEDKEAKRRFLLSMFVDFVVTASPHLNRFAPVRILRGRGCVSVDVCIVCLGFCLLFSPGVLA